MQEELNRIRSKDFSHIDERLYNNLGMTSELDQTIAQLAELQKYLKSQIDSIEDEGQKEAAVRASQIVILEMSTVRHNKCQPQITKSSSCQCKHHFVTVLQKIQRLTKSFKNTKQIVKRQIKNCIADVSEIVSDNIGYFHSISSRKSSETTKLKNQISSLQVQVSTLHQQNSELSQKLTQWQQAEKRLKLRRERHQSQQQTWSQYSSNNNKTYGTHKKQQQVKSIYINTVSEHHTPASTQYQHCDGFELGSCTDRYTVCQSSNENNMYRERQFKSLQSLDCDNTINNETPRLPMPLRRESSAKKQSQDKFKSCQNSIILQEQKANMTRTTKNSPCHNYKQPITNSPTSMLKQKQNEMLRLKGMKEVNRKSTRKLKLISMI